MLGRNMRLGTKMILQQLQKGEKCLEDLEIYFEEKVKPEIRKKEGDLPIIPLLDELKKLEQKVFIQKHIRRPRSKTVYNITDLGSKFLNNYLRKGEEGKINFSIIE